MVLRKTLNYLVILLLATLAAFLATQSHTLSVLLILAVPALFLYVIFIRGVLNLYHYVLIFIPLLIFSPPLRIASGIPAIRLDDLWLMFGAVVFATQVLLRNQKIKFKWNASMKLFVAFFGWIALTILFSSFREPQYYATGDWFELVKIGKLVLIFAIIMNLKHDEKQFKTIANTLIISLFITAVFGIFQYFNFLNINAWLSGFYIGGTNVSGFYDNGRVVGTYGNPNIFAGALLIGASLSLSKLIVKFNVSNLLVLSVFVFSLFLTLSRTGLIALAVVGVSVILFSLIRYRNRIKVMVVSSLLVPLGIFLLNYAPEKFFMRVGNLNDINSDMSFSVRQKNWDFIIQSRTMNNLITGTGPTSRLPITFDNEWLHLVTHYGIIGILLFLMIFSSIFLKIRASQLKDIRWIQIAAQAMIVGFAFYMITSSVFHALQLMPILLICLAIAYRLSIKGEGIENKE